MNNRCLLRIFSTGKADSASWYSIWAAAEATFAKCARNRKFGNFRGLGRLSMLRREDFVNRVELTFALVGDHGNIFFALASILSTESLGNSSLVEIE